VHKGLITQAEWARSHGFGRQYAGRLVKSRKIALIRGKVDPLDADRRLAAYQDPVKRSLKAAAVKPTPHAPRRPAKTHDQRTQDSLPDQLLRARIKKEREDGTLKEIERKKRQGELIDARESRAASQTRATAEREAFLAWPRRLSADMAVDLGVEEKLLLQVLQKYVRQHLTERSSPPLGNHSNAANGYHLKSGQRRV
jgi:hypothetical protein